MANDATKVSFGKPKAGGAIWRAPLGSTLPTSESATLDVAFKCLGYVSEDGLTNANSPSSEEFKAWGGDVVATSQTEKPDTFQFKLIEILNVDALKAVYGDANVTGTLETGITIRANSSEPAASAYVIDMDLTNGVKKRIVVPNAKLQSLGDVVYKDNEIAGYDMTIMAMPYTEYDGDTHREYIGPTGATGAT